MLKEFEKEATSEASCSASQTHSSQLHISHVRMETSVLKARVLKYVFNSQAYQHKLEA